MQNKIEAGYDDDDDDDHDHDGYGDDKLGWIMLMVTIVSIVNLFIIIFFNDSCVFQLPRSTLQIP